MVHRSSTGMPTKVLVMSAVTSAVVAAWISATAAEELSMPRESATASVGSGGRVSRSQELVVGE